MRFVVNCHIKSIKDMLHFIKDRPLYQGPPRKDYVYSVGDLEKQDVVGLYVKEQDKEVGDLSGEFIMVDGGNS